MSRRAVCLVVALFMTVSAGCATSRPGAPREPDPARVEILAELERYYADFSARRWSAFASHFWPGATITTVWQPPGEAQPRVVATTVPEFIAKAPEGPDAKAVFEERMTGADVRVERDLAQVWASYSARFGDPGAVSEWSGVDAFTLIRHDGQWKIIALAFAGDE